MSSSWDHKPKSDESLKLKLKPRPKYLPHVDLSSRSDELHFSPISSQQDPRTFYLNHVHTKHGDKIDPAATVPPPLVSASPFVPRSLIRLLMRGKKDSALAVKYVQGDSITDMDGAMHTFVTPVIGRCEMVGDYKYEQGHGVVGFGNADHPKGKGRVRLTRSVAMSALIQSDFETPKIMLRVCKLGSNEVTGKDLLHSKEFGDRPWDNCILLDKQDDQERAAYDASLRSHMVFHLTSHHRLPARRDVGHPLSIDDAISFLESVIKSKRDVEDQFVHKFLKTPQDEVVSLELLYNTAVQQVINEFSALEALFPQGYVYTYDPPSIFAREISAPVLNRLFLAAVKTISNHNVLANLRTFAINDYADKNIVDLERYALFAQAGNVSPRSYEVGMAVRCVGKRYVYSGNGGHYDARHHEKGAMLVIHNNSDGFGQNIETEGSSGSMDGAIGASSSASASLQRTRKDLLDFVF